MIIFIVDEGGDDSAETLGAMSGRDGLYDARGLEGGLELRFRIRVRICLLYTSPSPRDATLSRMPSSA